MLKPINNDLEIKCSKETFKEIVKLLIDEKTGITTYNKFWSIPEGIDPEQEYAWWLYNYECPIGIMAFADYKKQTLFFETIKIPAVKCVEYIAKRFPDATIKYGVDYEGFGKHEIWSIYKNGILATRDD